MKEIEKKFGIYPYKALPPLNWVDIDPKTTELCRLFKYEVNRFFDERHPPELADLRILEAEFGEIIRQFVKRAIKIKFNSRVKSVTGY